MARPRMGVLSVIVNPCVYMSVLCHLYPHGPQAENWMALPVVVSLGIRNKDLPVNPNFSAAPSLCMWSYTLAFWPFFFSEPFSLLLVPALSQNRHTFEVREAGLFPRNRTKTTKQVTDQKSPTLEHAHTQTVFL